MAICDGPSHAGMDNWTTVPLPLQTQRLLACNAEGPLGHKTEPQWPTHPMAEKGDCLGSLSMRQHSTQRRHSPSTSQVNLSGRIVEVIAELTIQNTGKPGIDGAC